MRQLIKKIIALNTNPLLMAELKGIQEECREELKRIEQEEAKIDFHRIKNDTNGNPRYVVHFLELNTREELDGPYLENKYELALNRAHKLGGRKFHNKQYGGGIVFQCYSLPTLERDIKELRGW